MPIFTFIGTLVAGVLFGGSVIAANLIAAGLSLGAKLGLSAYLNRKKARRYSAVQAESQIGGAVPVSTLFGIGKTQGHRLAYFKFGKGNKFNAEVFRLAHGWCDGLEPEIWFYGEKYALVARPIIGNEVAHYGVEGFDDLISLRFYDGRPGQLADMKLVADTAGLGTTWKAASTCANMAYVVLERKYSKKHFKRGKPTFEFVFRGLRHYDFRKDSTMPGGAGPQRLNNQATWVFSQNPAVLRFNYQLGRRGLVSGRVLIGEGKSIGQLDLDSYATAMTACDQLRKGKPTYQANLWVNADDDHTEILKEFEDAMAGYALNRGGLSGVLAGAPQIPVMVLTDDDISLERGGQRQNRKSAFSLYNQLSGQFTSRETWEAESLKPIKVNADIAADGRPRATANDFLQVLDADVGQYLLNIRYRQQRLGGTWTVPVSRRSGLKCVEGKWLIEPDGTEWLIKERKVSGLFKFTLELAQTSSSIYDDADIPAGPIVPAPIPAINPALASTIQNFNVQAGELVGADGAKRPVLRFTWTPPDDETITAVDFFYSPDGGVTVFEDRSIDVEKGEYITDKNVTGGRIYTARASIDTTPPRLTTFTPWVSSAATANAFWPISIANVNDEIKGLARWAEQLGRDVWDRIQALDMAAASEVLIAWDHRQEIRRELYATTGDMSAKVDEKITVATGPTSALAQQITAVDARFANYAPVTVTDAITTRVTANEGVLNTYGQRLTTVEAGLDGKASNSALMALTAEVEDNGEAIASSNSAILTLQNDLSGKVSNDVFNVLASEVEDQGDTLASTNSATTTLQNALTGYNGDYAVANAFSAMDTEITDIGDVVAAQANRVDGVYAALGGNSSEIMVAFSAVAGPAGYSTFGIVGKNTAGGAVRDASAFLMVPSDPAKPTRWAFTSDEFLIRDSAGNLAALFKAGETYIDAGFIRELNVTNLTVTGKFNGADIVGDGTLGAGQIAHNQLTYWATGSGSRGPGLNTPGVPSNVANVTVPVTNENPSPVTLSLVGRINGGNPGTLTVRIRRSYDNSIVNTWSYTGPSVRDIVFYSLDAQIQQGTYDYVFEYVGSFAGSFNVTMTVQVSRR